MPISDWSSDVCSSDLQSGRDRDQSELSLRSGYEFAPHRQVYALGAVNNRRYDNTLDSSGFARDSDGYLMALGTSYDIDGVIILALYAGYREQTYEDADRKSRVKGQCVQVRVHF